MGYTTQEVDDLIRRADKAGDTAAVRRLLEYRGQVASRSQGTTTPRPSAPTRPSFGEQVGRSVVNSVAGVAQGITALPDTAIEGIGGLLRMGVAPVARASSAAFRGLGMDGAANRVDSNARTFDRALSQPFTGYRAIENIAPTQQGMGASRFAAQVVGGLMVPFGPKAARAAPPRIPAQPVAAAPTPARAAIPPALAAADPVAAQAAPLGRRAAVRLAQFRRAGVQNPTTGMVTRDPGAWKFERETAKLVDTGTDMRDAITGVSDDIANAARGIVDRQGGSIGREATGARLGKVLSDKNAALEQEISALYKAVREQSGNIRIPTLENLKATYSHPEWADNALFDDAVSMVNKRLARYADADGGAAGLTVGQAEELRKFIGGIGPNDKTGYAIRSVLKNALDADVLDNFGGTPFANARAAAAARFAEFGKTLPGKVAAGDIPPERLPVRLLSDQTPLDDVRALTKSLTTGRTAAQGKEALDTLGAQVLDDLFAKHITPERTVRGASLLKDVNALSPRLRIILGPERYKEVRRLAQVAQYATGDIPAAGVNYSNTASMLANMLGPEATKAATSNLLPNLARRAAGTVVGAAFGNVPGAIVGDQAAAAVNRSMTNRATQASAAKLASQIAIARDPIKAAESIAAVAASPKTDPVVRQFAQRLLTQIEAAGPYAARAALPALGRADTLLLEQVPLRASAGETPEQPQR